MEKYPSFRLDVYKTHRSAAFPKYVLENTVKQATTTKTANNGLTVVGAHAAYPFPIPKDGYEAMWNHILFYNGITLNHFPQSWVVTAAGRPTMTYVLDEVLNWPYWVPTNTKPDIFWRLRDICIGPPRNVGEMPLGLRLSRLLREGPARSGSTSPVSGARNWRRTSISIRRTPS